MPTAIFDVDGTLTDTNDVDDECYIAAVLAELGYEIGPDWDGVEDVTDAQILRAVWSQHNDRPLPPPVEQAVLHRFLGLLEAQLAAYPARFRPIPGATEAFRLVADFGWTPVVGTGGWRPSAQLKLEAAGIPFSGVPLSTSSEHVSRIDIIGSLVPPDRDGKRDVVYFGDGLWDLEVAKILNLHFVGVGSGSVAERLQDAGAAVVLPDLSDPSLIVDVLST